MKLTADHVRIAQEEPAAPAPSPEPTTENGADPYPEAGEGATPEVQDIIREYKSRPRHKRKRPLLYHLLGRGTPAYKVSKEEAEYQNKPKGDQKCGNCRFAYKKVVNGKLICSQIRGEIKAEAWCNLWKAEK